MTIPGNLYPYHLDDSHITIREGDGYATVVHDLSTAEKTALFALDNAIAMAIGGSAIKRHGFVFFPQLMDLDAIWFAQSNFFGSISDVWVSPDATNPTDIAATWIDCGDQLVAIGSAPLDNLLNSNPAPHPLANGPHTGIRAIRWGITTTGQDPPEIRQLMIFGRPTDAQAHSLAFWDPTLDQEAPDDWSDFGAISPGSSATVTVRVKNLSTTQTANNVTMQLADAYRDMNASVSSTGGGVEFSDDGGATWSEGPLNLGNLAPGTISSVISIRRTIEAGSSLDADCGELRAAVGSWS